MSAFLGHLKKNKIIYAIILLFFVAKLLTVHNYKVLWWDSAVYIGMGKYIYSFGNAGLWENSRPIVWPLMLGFLWKIGLDVIIIGRILEIIFGGLCILLTYLVGRKLFNEKTAILSSIFLAASPTFFFFNGIMLTEIVSTFFALLAVYFFIDKKYFASGLLLGTSFMARFLQLFVFFALIFIALIHTGKKNIKNTQKIIIGFAVAALPFLILNQILYNNALFPFIQQAILSKNSGWPNYLPPNYYFIELFKENFLYLLSIFGILLMLKSKNAGRMAIAFASSLFLMFFNSINQKEMRFLIILFPYMYLSASYIILGSLKLSKNRAFKAIILAAVMLSIFLSIMHTTEYYKNESNKKNPYQSLQAKFGDYGVNGQIWVSNPIISEYSNKKISNLMYYPFFDYKKKKELMKESDKADFIFADSCDLACNPSDILCESSKNSLFEQFKRKFRTAYSSKASQCWQFVFHK